MKSRRRKKNRAQGFGYNRPKAEAGLPDESQLVPDPARDKESAWAYLQTVHIDYDGENVDQD